MKTGTIQFTDQEAQHMHQSSISMGSAALVLSILVCVAIVGYRMVFGNDHGHAPCSSSCSGGSASGIRRSVLDRRRSVLDARRAVVPAIRLDRLSRKHSQHSTSEDDVV